VQKKYCAMPVTIAPRGKKDENEQFRAAALPVGASIAFEKTPVPLVHSARENKPRASSAPMPRAEARAPPALLDRKYGNAIRRNVRTAT